MKKFSVLLSILLIMSFAFFALGSTEDTNDDQGSGSANQESSTANLGDYNISIESCRLAKSFDNKNIVIVKYTFTNVSNDNATSFTAAVSDQVYQNGIGLNKSYFVDDSANYSSDNQTKDIKKGASIEVEVAYELNDTTTDIEIEVSEFISFNNSIVKKTFSIK